MFKTFGRAALVDYFDDWVVYRNLEPLDKRVPGLRNAGYRMGMNDDHIPRKQEKEYAKAAVWIIEEARDVCKFNKPVEELLFIGDTLYNDGAVCRNMVALTGWKGSCFIGADRLEQEAATKIDDDGLLFNANRWVALVDWLQWLRQQGFQLDQTTAVVVDIDKTALGPKGRNDQVIDKARLQGIFRTMDAVLEDRFDGEQFVKVYGELNRAKYHFLTADNQDYLAYICLIVNAKLIGFDELLAEIENSNLQNFDQFIRWVESLMIRQISAGDPLREVHEAVLSSVRTGDPTPFKRFRRQEFLSTLEFMGQMPDTSSAEELLRNEITLNEEVLQTVDWLKARGVSLLCLSDKPDEASKPSGREATTYQSIHKVSTHRVGVDLSAELAKISK